MEAPRESVELETKAPIPSDSAAEQLRALALEVSRLVNRKWWRWVTVWTSGAVGPLARYRFERALYLLVGRPYPLARLILMPLFALLRVLGRPLEIHYRAQIGPGLRVLHPGLGVVISAHAVCGKNFVLVGGNCVGSRKQISRGQLMIGDDVTMGANAVVLGPVKVGSRCQVGAGAVVTKDLKDDVVAVGVPARVIATRTGSEALPVDE